MTACHVTVEEGGRSLVRLLLADQQRLTAVERFGAKHDQDALPALAKYYRDLIPLSEPRDGEQSGGYGAADTPFKKVRVVTTVDFYLN